MHEESQAIVKKPNQSVSNHFAIIVVRLVFYELYNSKLEKCRKVLSKILLLNIVLLKELYKESVLTRKF